MALAMDDIKTSLTIGYERVMANPVPNIMPMLVLVGVGIAFWALGHLTFLALLLIPVRLVVNIVLGANLIEAMMAIHDGRPFAVGDMFKIHPHLANYFAGAFIVGVGAVIGMILLVIPGLIWIGLTWPAQYLIIERNVSAMDAIQQSISVCKDNLMPALAFLLVIGIINMIGVIFLVLPLLLTGPITGVAAVHVYRQLFGGGKVNMRKS